MHLKDRDRKRGGLFAWAQRTYHLPTTTYQPPTNHLINYQLATNQLTSYLPGTAYQLPYQLLLPATLPADATN